MSQILQIIILGKFGEILGYFGKFGEVLGDFATISALSCAENLAQKLHLWRKMTNMRSEWELNTAALPLRSPVFAESFTIFFHTETLQQSIILPSTAWNRLLAIHQMRRQPNLTKPT